MQDNALKAAAIWLTLASPAALTALPAAEPDGLAIYAVDRDGKNNGLLIAEPILDRSLLGTADWSPDGHWLAVNVKGLDEPWQQSRIVLFGVAGEERGVVKELGFGQGPSWSPDGTRLAFYTNPGAPGFEQSGIHVMDTDGNLVTSYGVGIFPVWSPDGNLIAAKRSFGSNNGICVYQVSGGEPMMMSLPGDVSHYQPKWGPDNTIIMPVQDGEVRRLMQYRIADGQLVPVRTLMEGIRAVTGDFASPTYCPGTGEIFFKMRVSEDGRGVHRLSLDGDAEPFLVMPFEKPIVVKNLSVSPDGQRIAYTTNALYTFVE